MFVEMIIGSTVPEIHRLHFVTYIEKSQIQFSISSSWWYATFFMLTFDFTICFFIRMYVRNKCDISHVSETLYVYCMHIQCVRVSYMIKCIYYIRDKITICNVQIFVKFHKKFSQMDARYVPIYVYMFRPDIQQKLLAT